AIIRHRIGIREVSRARRQSGPPPRGGWGETPAGRRGPFPRAGARTRGFPLGGFVDTAGGGGPPPPGARGGAAAPPPPRRRRCLARLEGGPFPGLVVAVSGGPDSVALTRAVLAVRGESSAAPLVLAHLNHRLRGAESDADESFVAELHADLTMRGATELHLC